MVTFRFQKSERLRKRKDFLAASKEARRRLETKSFRILLRSNLLPGVRLGVTVTKKVGSAVVRNRIKRQVREFFRLHKHHMPPGFDILVIAQKPAAELNHDAVQEELKILVDRPFG